MTEFKVGDKVVFGGDLAEVVYGAHFPAYTDTYTRVIVRLPSGKERTVPVAELTPRPAFKAGDRAMMRDAEVTIVFGPYTDHDGWTGYLTKDESGEHFQASASELSPLPQPAPLKAGDRIRILRSCLSGANVTRGDVFTVDESSVRTDEFGVDSRGPNGGHWYFDLPDEGTGWERVTD